ncbi:MAG: SagB/ThcOx family dehydrogenase [Thermofilaceae archaeon]
MRLRLVYLAAAVAAAVAVAAILLYRGGEAPVGEAVVVGEEVLLPLPRVKTEMRVEEALLHRKSIREWRDEPLDVEDLALLLWAAQGVTEHAGWDWYRRTAPSAGATYPLEVYVVIGEKGVRSGSGYLEAGVYRYNPFRHSLTLVRRGDARRELWEASWRQDWVRDAPVSIVICAVYERTTSRYGERGVRYVILEAGHVGQNIYLMATALNLGTVAIGAFDDAAVARAISARAGEAPLYVYPVGVPRELYRGSFDEVRRLIEGMRRG